jgi:hypothetical protein
VAVLGDSLTWGTTTAEETYTRYAESELGPPWQILNFSHYGYDIQQSVATLRSRVWPYAPDLVVYAAYTNDFVPSRLITVGDPPWLVWVGASGGLLPPALSQRSALLRRVEGALLARDVTDRPDPAFFQAGLDALVAEVPKNANDGEHPSPEGHRVLGHALADILGSYSRGEALAPEAARAAR